MRSQQLNRTDDCPLLSIVIPTKNRHASLQRLLASIESQDYPNFEVIVIDDGSDRPVNLGKQNTDNFSVLRNVASQGCCAARNGGIEKARGEFVIVLDDDAEFNDPSTVSRAVGLIQNHPECGAIGFSQLKPDGEPQYMQPAHTDVACFTSIFFGYGFLLRKSAVARIGNFNTVIGIYYDENEFCLRLVNAGYKIIFDPSLRVIHHHDPVGRDPMRMHRLVLRNSIITAMLHSPVSFIPPQIFKRLVQFIRLSRQTRQSTDFDGLSWVCREIWEALPEVRKQRRPMKLQVLRIFRQLNRQPVALN